MVFEVYMNKKQMLKEQKRLKEERKQTEKLFNDDKEVYNVFKIGLGVLVFIGLAFVIINIANGTWNIFNKKNNNVTEIDSKMVMAGTMFNKEDNEYYVLAYDMNDDKNDFYGVIIDNYHGNKELYLLNLASGFNKDFIGEKAVISDNLSKLKFHGSTLLLIKKDKIVKSYQIEEEIINILNNN